MVLFYSKHTSKYSLKTRMFSHIIIALCPNQKIQYGVNTITKSTFPSLDPVILFIVVAPPLPPPVQNPIQDHTLH